MTHIAVFNIGSFNDCYGVENIPRVKQKVWERTEHVVSKLNLPLLEVDSNFQSVVPQNHYFSHTYMDAFAIYALQKLWRVYYYAGAYPFNRFALDNNTQIPAAKFDLFLWNCFSTSRLRIIPEGCEYSRHEKIKFIADFPIVQKNLHVCTAKEFNCGVCPKCLRTLLAIDALNRLDDFREAFDIDAYIKNRVNAYLFLFQKYVLEKDVFFEESFKILYHRHKKFFDSIVVEKK